MIKHLMLTTLIALAAVGCGPSYDDDDYYDYVPSTVNLVVENRSGTDLWSMQYAPCDSGQWTEMIGNNEYVPSGSDVAARNLSPGCYDIRIENENSCNAEARTGNLSQGIVYTWTIREQDFSFICI